MNIFARFFLFYWRFLRKICMLKLDSIQRSEAEFKEFELRLKSKTRLKHGWIHLKLYSVLKDLSRRSIGTVVWRFSDVV